jgi:hypothetical protein
LLTESNIVSALAAPITHIDHAGLKSPAPIARSTCQIERFAAGASIQVDTSDFEEFRAFTPGWNIDYQLIGDKKSHIKVSAVTTAAVQLARVQLWLLPEAEFLVRNAFNDELF